MKTFVTPDQNWLHGIKNGVEYCLGRPNPSTRLAFSEEGGFALDAFLPTVTEDYALLSKVMWDFANGRPVALENPKVCAFIHMLKRFCDIRRSDCEFETIRSASDTYRIVELMAEVEELKNAQKGIMKNA